MKGLLKFKKDKRDFSHRRTFGSVSVSQLPAEFYIEPLEIENQFATNFCTSFASTECAENQDNVKFSAEWMAAKEGQITGASIAFVGTDLRTPMEVGRKMGFLPQTLAPFSLANKDEGFLADWKNWDASLDAEAQKYKMDGYYTPDGFNDTFDNIRTAMFVASQDPNDNKRSVVVGSKWYAEWERLNPDGIIPEQYSQQISLHAHRIIGWTIKNGQPYLIDQQAQGPNYGDHGLAYFSRAVVNREFNEGAFIFRKNPDPNQIKTISAIVGLLSKIVALLYQFFPPSVKPQPPIVNPINVDPPPPAPLDPPHVSKIPLLADGIQEAEGWNPTSRSCVNHNPGNIKFTPYVQLLGAVGKDAGNFAIFPSYEIGRQALIQFCTDACTNKLKAFRSTMSLDQFVSVYAEPPSVPAHATYVATIIKNIKVVPKQISELL
jgi:hypothetical protein